MQQKARTEISHASLNRIGQIVCMLPTPLTPLCWRATPAHHPWFPHPPGGNEPGKGLPGGRRSTLPPTLRSTHAIHRMRESVNRRNQSIKTWSWSRFMECKAI